jgi:putative endonuclease
MANHNELGKRGESIAVDYLIKKGYTILDTNWTFQKAEIDIIAFKGSNVIIVEVKTRSRIDFGLPQDFVKPKQIQQMIKAVDAYVQKLQGEWQVRFDIIAIYFQEKSFDLEHLEDAFYYF